MNATSPLVPNADNDAARRILDTLLTSVVVLDDELRVRFMNSSAEILLALSFRQARGQRFQALAHCPGSILAALRQSLDDGTPFTEREVLLTLPGEHAITVDFTVLPMVGNDGAGNDGAGNDGAGGGDAMQLLVELRQLDRQLRINREEHLLAQHHTARILIRNLAHEVKNPLGGVRGAAQLLERELPDPELREYTRIIIGEVDRLRSLVDRMLGPSHPPRHGEVNIHEVLERVRTLVLAENGPELHISQDYDPSIPPLTGDADQLIQATLNIVRNAAQALDGRGTVVLRTRVQRQCNIGPRRYRLLAQIDVIDDGPGIPEPFREDIFYPMVSGSSRGSGLGLSIAQILIGQHGGLIEFTSRPGETVFSLLLPLEPADG